MTGALLAMLADKPEIDVSAHLPLVTNLLLFVLVLLIAFFLVRPELWRRIFFQRVDPRPAALMRIGFGMVVLWTFLDLLKPHGPLEDSVARYLFTDEGLWLTDMARKNYGGQLKTLWDPEHGFEHWYDIFKAMWGKFSILHFRSDPPFVFGVYTAMMASLTLMIFGVWTRWTTILSWILVESIYRYSPVYYTGGDTVVRVFMFLGMFTAWGQAYSVDSWRRRRKAILKGAVDKIPPLPTIAAWPMRLMMLQLAIIYCATGLLKSGATWANGTALYFSLNLEHFYRWPQMGLIGALQYIGILPVLVILVHWWEMLFPLGMIGAALNAYERERLAGTWPRAPKWRRWLSYLLFFSAWGIGAYIAGIAADYYAPAKLLKTIRMSRPAFVILCHVVAALIPVIALSVYFGLRRASTWTMPPLELEDQPRAIRIFMSVRWVARWMLVHSYHFMLRWAMGKRFWLVVGFGMHIGIDLGMNVGTFANVMIAVYPAWLSGAELDAFWKYFFSVPQTPGQGNRPVRSGKLRVVLSIIDRFLYRTSAPPVTILHNPDDASVRRAALLRVWDLGHQLEFKADSDVPAQTLLVRPPGETNSRMGADAGVALIKVLPGLWPMRILRRVPGVNRVFGFIAIKILRQR